MRRLVIAVALLCGMALPVGAQFAQYFTPGGPGEGEDPLRTTIEKEMQRSRWHLGPVQLQPWIGIRNIGYMDNVYGTQVNQKSDFTVSAGAGLRAYLPLGSRTVVFARAMPEYVWWKELVSRRGWAGRYSAGFYTFFNRLTLEAWANRVEQDSVINSELDIQVRSRLDAANVSLDTRLFRRVSVVTQFSRHQIRKDPVDITGGLREYIKALERDEDIWKLGLHYTPTEALSITVGGSWSSVDFQSAFYDRSNDGQGLYANLTWKAPRFTVSATASQYTASPWTHSQFRDYEGTTGQASLTYNLPWRVRWQLYGGRTLAYSTQAGAGYYIESRVGTAFGRSFGWRFNTTLFAEKGTYDYPVAPGAASLRNGTTAGVLATIKLLKDLSVGVSAAHVEARSDVETRKLWRVQTTVGYTGTGLSWW